MLHHVLFPGRHHLLTRFQARYLADLLGGWRHDDLGEPITVATDATVVWAVTSANHQNTRRNPVAAHRREAAIEQFSWREGLRSVVVPIVDVAATDRFAEITIKNVEHASGLTLTPDDTIVACSTPAVAQLYRDLGFRIASVEHDDPAAPATPWQLLDRLAAGDDTWRRDTHPASTDVLDRYGLVDHIRMLAADPIVGDEGSLTDTRDYRTYSTSFEQAAQRKWTQARPYVRPGRIVDIGCATGGMLELAAADPGLAESDLFGVEVARHLYEECEHKKAQGAFDNPNTFFYQRNVLAGRVFPDRSVDTTLTFALTHEIYSYGAGADDLGTFAATIAAHTAPGGRWINSDVCGPAEPDRRVRLNFRDGDVTTAAVDLRSVDARRHLDALPPASRVAQFAQDFHGPFAYDVIDERTVDLPLRDAMEFLETMSYTDNWLSEMHETFCHFSWSDWVALVDSLGLVVDPRSGPWRNEWLVDNVFAPAATLTRPDGTALDWPDTHVLLVAAVPGAESL